MDPDTNDKELLSSLTLKERKLNFLNRKNETRKLKREEQKQLKTQQLLPDNENVNLVLAKFERLEVEISEILKRIEAETEGEEAVKDSLPPLFDTCFCKLEEWQNTISLASHILKIYHKKQLQDKYHAFNDKRQKLEKTLIPEQKFSFKKSSLKDKKNDSHGEHKLETLLIHGDELDSVAVAATSDNTAHKKAPSRSFVIHDDELSFSDRENENLTLDHDQMRKKDAVFRNLRNCRMTVEGGANTLHFVSLTDCRIVCGPVSTSVMVDDCKRCVFVFACQQLRIHRTVESDFYVHVTSRCIIEDSERVRFAPYNWRYENIEQHFDSCGLRRSPNNWNLVDDFNWLSSEPSPHWSVIAESERDFELLY